MIHLPESYGRSLEEIYEAFAEGKESKEAAKCKPKTHPGASLPEVQPTARRNLPGVGSGRADHRRRHRDRPVNIPGSAQPGRRVRGSSKPVRSRFPPGSVTEFPKTTSSWCGRRTVASWRSTSAARTWAARSTGTPIGALPVPLPRFRRSTCTAIYTTTRARALDYFRVDQQEFRCR